MTLTRKLMLLGAIAALIQGCASPMTRPAPAAPAAPAATRPAVALHVPIEYYRLSNGLRVVLSPDHSVPVATIGVYYNIGFRIEPRDRTGFAHLFEHLMFQGSTNLPKGEFSSSCKVRVARSTGPPASISPTTTKRSRRIRWKRCCGLKPIA
jgi:hypothetical protein